MIHTLRISLLARTRGLASARGSAPVCALRPKPKPRPIYILFWRRPYAPAARPPAVRVRTPGRPPRRLSLCRVSSRVCVCVRESACVVETVAKRQPPPWISCSAKIFVQRPRSGRSAAAAARAPAAASAAGPPAPTRPPPTRPWTTSPTGVCHTRKEFWMS